MTAYAEYYLLCPPRLFSLSRQRQNPNCIYTVGSELRLWDCVPDVRLMFEYVQFIRSYPTQTRAKPHTKIDIQSDMGSANT